MRNVNYLIALFVLLLSACKKEEKDVSMVVPVIFPKITLKGQEYISLNINDSYSDQGAVLYDTLAGTTTDIDPKSNDIDVTTPGIYVVSFFARNKWGFETTKERYVAVTSVNPSIDLSGEYERTSNGAPVKVTKIGTGLYRIDNVGGVAPATSPAVLPVVMAMINDSTITLPRQSVPNGYGVLDFEDPTLTDSSFSYKIVGNSGFSEALRSFVRVK